MVQQILHQSFANTRKRSHSPCKSITERDIYKRDIIYNERDADTLIQISYNTQKKNEEWKVINGKKKNWNNLELITICKIPKTDNWLSKLCVK
jgi:hypothetical protein